VPRLPSLLSIHIHPDLDLLPLRHRDVPSVEEIVIDFPVFDSPNSFERSIVITSLSPSTFISTFFIVANSCRTL